MKNNRLQQTFYKYITTPLAKALDFINVPKRIKLRRKQRKLAMDNMCSYIEVTSKLLLEQDIQEHLAKGEAPNPVFLPILIAQKISEAEDMFREKKANGDFDELNILIN